MFGCCYLTGKDSLDIRIKMLTGLNNVLPVFLKIRKWHGSEHAWNMVDMLVRDREWCSPRALLKGIEILIRADGMCVRQDWESLDAVLKYEGISPQERHSLLFFWIHQVNEESYRPLTRMEKWRYSHGYVLDDNGDWRKMGSARRSRRAVYSPE